MLATNGTLTGTSSLCSGCANAIVCKWSERFIEAEKELKEKTKVNRTLDDNDVYSIMNVNITCKFYRTEMTNRLFGNDWNNINPCSTPSDTTGTLVGTKVYYTNEDILDKQLTGITTTNNTTTDYLDKISKKYFSKTLDKLS